MRVIEIIARFNSRSVSGPLTKHLHLGTRMRSDGASRRRRGRKKPWPQTTPTHSTWTTRDACFPRAGVLGRAFGIGIFPIGPSVVRFIEGRKE